MDLFRAIREAWIVQLDAEPTMQALGLAFVDMPAITRADIEDGNRAGYVQLGDEVTTQDDDVLRLTIITTVVAGALDAKSSEDLIAAARPAIIAAYRTDPELGGLVGRGRYAGSQRVVDGDGNRVYGARHYMLTVDYLSPEIT